jgi:geranylgeranyl diphosphate synthase type II
LSAQGRRVDEGLDKFLLSAKAEPPVVHEAMRYSVFAGGKRLRPILCMAAAEICGGSWRKVLPAACALEMIHTYSLIHDDLPAMDDDDFRRGQSTCHKQFGEAVAILAGDALLTHAFQVIADNANVSGVKAAAVIDAIRAVAEAAGSLGMVGGQVADLEMENKGQKISNREKALDYIHRHKTGALIRASLKSGAILSNANEDQLDALDRYGESIGLTFQIVDDVLDIVGDKKLLGKRGSDRDNGKLTFPSVYGLDESREMARKEIRRAKAALEIFGKKGEVLSDLADFILHRQH